MPLRRPFLALVFVALLGGCGGPSTSAPTDSPPLEANATAALETSSPRPSLVEPADSASPATTPAVTPAATAPEVPEPTPEEPDVPGPASACTGTDANRDFYESVASAVDWTVYCPVLPSGWFVDSGEYRLASGGEMRIAYRGPGGARLELNEGTFCMDADGCVPSGREAGQTAFGDRTATLVATETGGWAGIVDRAAEISFLATASGVDEDSFRALLSDLIAVSG
jgi:hypothetical protein